MYRHDKGMVSEDDNRALHSGRPSYGVLKRVFYVAIPSMEKIAKQMGKDRDVFDLDVLREFYSGEHNERKFKEGELACIAFPVKVLEKKSNGSCCSYLISMEPVLGKYWVESDLELEPGDWAVMHRINLVEQVPEGLAMAMKAGLEKLGLDKTYKFPKVAIKYLKELRDKRTRDFHGNEQADQGPPDEGKDEASEDQGGPKEIPDKGSGEAYA